MRKLYVVGALTAMGAAAPMAYAVLDRSEQAEIAAVQAAKLSLQDAIKAARTASPGAPVEAGLEVDDGSTFYEVSLYADGRLTTVKLDPDSGRVITASGETADEDRDEEGDDADSDDLAEGATTAAQPVDLVSAIAAARAHVAGAALEASLEQDGQIRYHVGIVQDGVVRDVQVDPRTGHVIPSHRG